MFTKIFVVGLAIFVLGILEALLDKVAGIDFSSISKSKKLAHDVTLILGGVLIGALVSLV